MNIKILKKVLLILLLIFFTTITLNAQSISLGKGSYTTSFPGTDSAGRNGFPSGSPQLSGSAIGKPVPTNDWWSKLVKEDHADNLFNYPMTLKTTNQGLITTYIPWGVIGDNAAIRVGLTGLNTSKTTVSNYSDWTVTMNWKDASHELSATAGIAMPFIYFEKNDDAEVRIEVNSGNATVQNEMLIVENASSGADFVIYAPTGSTWNTSGNTYTSSLNNKNYWSLIMLPQSTSNVTASASNYKKYAYVFPVDTKVDWSYNNNTAMVTTNFTVTTSVKEGIYNNVLQGLLPHQWDHLTTSSPKPNGETYASVRGELKMLDGNQFSVENRFSGILPTLPYLANYSDGFSPAAMADKINQIKNDGLPTWTDSYNEGQLMNRLIQTARIADQTGDIEARDKMIATIKERLEDWLTYQSGEKAFLFYYNSNWSAMLGYPAGHGQDNNINDHHFHWGYFIHAAAFLEQFQPGWVNEWGAFINYLIRDAASPDRNDTLFPFLRNFSPYAGHCWANGFASFPQGNDQESTSESMQFNSSLIHWGTITGNDEIRDLGIYLYTTEQTAVEEYWFDMNERNFSPSQPYALVSRVWGNSYDNGTFWTSDITASYGIELYPMHGGSLYLGQNEAYQQKIWNELQANTGILSTSDTNPNLWHDTFWKYLSLLDPERAIELYNSYPNRNLKFGISDAQTYHWVHGMNALGKLKPEITANYPITAVFEKNGIKTYVAHNYTNTSLTVQFSDGFSLLVPAHQLATNRDVNVTGVISSDFDQAFPNGSVNLSVSTTGAVSKVEFFNNGTKIGEDTSTPFTFKATNLSLGKQGVYAKVYENDQFNVTNSVTITVGEQVPYSGTPIAIPGVFQAGHYDTYEGGVGQDISYVDLSRNNEGDFRTSEYVDAATVNGEGATIGWISSGEWVEYTVDVATSGNYDVSFRYASGNNNGGGPFYIATNGNKVSNDIFVSSTGDWDTFATKTVQTIPLQKGKQVIRLVFNGGEFNIGRLTFTHKSNLSYEPPVANAGDNVSVMLPTSTATLDGSGSSGPIGTALNYKWEQIYGPSTISFTNTTAINTNISNLEEGVYKCKLTVGYSTYSSSSEVLVIVTSTGNVAPAVNLIAPNNNTSFQEGATITLNATASDLDGTISKVAFYANGEKLGEDTTAPYTYSWSGASIGAHTITAIATDKANATRTSEPRTITVNEVKSCSEISKEAIQGSFSKGYNVTFETIGTNVNITFDLLDTDKVGVVAFLWKADPFEETQMDHISGNKFTKTIGGVSEGETIRYACKFAYAGGLSATQYFNYQVGESCSFTLPSDNFTIKTTGETCPNASNGVVEITSKATNSYNAILEGVSYTFSNQTTIANLAPGTYNLCITVEGLSYEQCYNIVVASSSKAIVSSVDNNQNTTIHIEEGTAPYKVYINNEQILETSETDFSLPVQQGDVINVKTALECEGDYQTRIDYYSNIRAYPNPTQGVISIDVPASFEIVPVQVFNAGSQAIADLQIKPTNNQIEIDLSEFTTGVYYLRLQLKESVIIKVVKL
ncbi:glycosyl hydrolase [Wenyingzhuangia sp. IMCC45574]